MRPLEGLLVLDFSQFLAGPSAALRLADLGARVIKIERPQTGDLCRQLYITNLQVDGDSTLFHSINRNKQSLAADLKNERDREMVNKLIARADVLIQSFRPGIMERLGFDYASVHRLNQRLVYGEVTGYGKKGPWRNKPGQDLLAQSLSGLPWLNGNASQPPLPFGLSVADLFAGAHLVQGILACLVRRGVTGQGGYVEVSLIESILDAQFELLTTFFNDGEQLPQRSAVNNANAYLGAPYGLYETKDGYISLAMGSVPRLGELLKCTALLQFSNPSTWFEERDAIKSLLAEHLKTEGTKYWLSILEPADIWCSDVLTWPALVQHEGFQILNMQQEIRSRNGTVINTTRCPIRIDGEVYKSPDGAPGIGQHSDEIIKEFSLQPADKQAGRRHDE